MKKMVGIIKKIIESGELKKNMKIMFMTLRDRVERFTDFSNLSKDWEYVFAGYEKRYGKAS